jgi:hypothetical protein
MRHPRVAYMAPIMLFLESAILFALAAKTPELVSLQVT